MKDTEIHDGLVDQILRDYLSNEIVLSFHEEFATEKKVIPYTQDDPIEWAIRDAESIVEFQKKRIKILKARQAVHILIERNGWYEFDISDLVTKEYHNVVCRSFIGTEEEYKMFFEKLNKKE